MYAAVMVQSLSRGEFLNNVAQAVNAGFVPIGGMTLTPAPGKIAGSVMMVYSLLMIKEEILVQSGATVEQADAAG